LMSVILKVDKGTAEKLLEYGDIKIDESRNLEGKELLLELKNNEVIMELHEKDYKNMLEISDVDGSFELLIELTNNKKERLKEIIEKTMGP